MEQKEQAVVLPDRRLVPSDGGDEVSPGPEVLSYEVAPALTMDPSQMNRALALDVSDDLRHRIFWWDRDHHVDVIDQQMPLLDPTFFLPGQLLEHFAEVLAQ